ncbi:MAG TPA: hypothetical protein VK571_07005 [Gemmatimonadaceae bacterium]|nr:hypothetical protein [Gemmatimonadaceae bacterium]
MVSTAASIAPAPRETANGSVSLARLYVLRAMYLLMIVGLSAMNLPELIGHELTARGVIPSLLGGIWLLAFLGLRYPLQMLPLLLFECAWKTIWLIDYGFPQWFAGRTPPTFAGDFQAILMVVIVPLVIPWRYVFRNYVKRPSDRWR